MQHCIRVVLADSYRMVARSLCRDLDGEHDVQVVELADNAHQAVAATVRHQPQVTVVDTELAGNGIHACQQIAASCPTTAVLVLSPFDWDIYLAQAWTAGAIGFITRCDTFDDLLSFLQQAQRGRPLFIPEQLARIQQWKQQIAPRLEALTAREWDVLQLIIDGKSNRDISTTLQLTESTVAKHITALLGKTHLESRHALISFAHQHHIQHYTPHVTFSAFGIRKP